MVEIIKMLAQQYADIRWAVEEGAITKEQYKEFTGNEYGAR
ncbi:XkdX family protein [Lactobacillus reuteri]|nr:XkdX family protein [Limosilactobacillus reuteri]MQB72793.1 XkdX family protein [Limosilactobacillus reuteri]